MSRFQVAVCAAALLCGADASASEQSSVRTEAVDVVTPKLGIQTTVDVGQPFVTRARGTSTTTTTVAIILRTPAEASSLGLHWKVPAEEPLSLDFTEAGGKFYKGLIDETSFGDTQKVVGGVYLPSDPTAKPALWINGFFGGREKHKLEHLDYGDATTPEAQADLFRQELVYGGVSQGTLSVTYREFRNDMARPAFTQELKYDLKDGDEIGFRGARVKVLKATNVDLTFVLEKPLSD